MRQTDDKTAVAVQEPQGLAEAAPGVCCRRIEERDLPALAKLLAEGFPARTFDYWSRALKVLAARPPYGDYPRFGFLLEVAGRPVGVLLTLFMPPTPAFGGVRCNFSSWYVQSEHRTYAHVPVARLLRIPDVTIVNISPAPHTWKIIEAQGFERYSEGLFAAVAWLSPGRGVAVRRVYADDDPLPGELTEADLLREHAKLGCIVLLAEFGAEVRPFVFVRRRLKGVPGLAVQLVYCRDTRDLVFCAGALGRWLLLREGAPLVVCDACKSIAGLIGRFFRNYTPKYFHGAAPPPLNDLANTELPLFGA